MNFKGFIGSFLILLCGLAFAGTKFDLNLGNRKAVVYVPDGINNPPLVISMHGIGNPLSMVQGMMQFETLADVDKFIVVYPEAEELRWDLGSNKDVDFIVSIIDNLYNQYQIDRNRVYASGFSMGGMMSWYLSCKIPDKIAAIVPGNGYPMGGMSGCSEVRHVPALQIHGDADDFVSYANFVNSFLPAQRTRYGCPSSPTTINPYPTEVNGRNSSQLAIPSRSYFESWEPCVSNGLTSELHLLTVHGMVHDWATPNKANGSDDPAFAGDPFDVNGTWEAWNWMKTHSLAGDVPIITIPPHRDSVFNGGFDLGAMGWTLNVWGGSAQGSIANDEYTLEVSTIGDQSHSIQLLQNGIILEQGKSYDVQFEAYSDVNRSLEANVEMDDSPWTSYLPALQIFNLTTTKSTYSYAFNMEHATDSNSRITFNAGAATGKVILDNISIQERSTPVLTNTFSNNSNLVSFTQKGSELTVIYTGTYYRELAMQLFDLKGNIIRTSLAKSCQEGSACLMAEISQIPSGVYFLRINSEGRSIYDKPIFHER
jgi:poly(3-hydroxybutyrate) depolymerase